MPTRADGARPRGLAISQAGDLLCRLPTMPTIRPRTCHAVCYEGHTARQVLFAGQPSLHPRAYAPGLLRPLRRWAAPGVTPAAYAPGAPGPPLAPCPRCGSATLPHGYRATADRHPCSAMCGELPTRGHTHRKRAQVNSAGEYVVADHPVTYHTAVQPPLIVTLRAPYLRAPGAAVRRLNRLT